jgi:hypothetical protein
LGNLTAQKTLHRLTFKTEHHRTSAKSFQSQSGLLPTAYCQLLAGLKTLARFAGVVLRLPFIMLLILVYPFFLTTIIVQDYFLAK